MIKRLAVFDFDGTLINSPEPENGKQFWQDKMGRQYPYSGWWGRPESLDLDVFEIKPFPSVLNQLKKEQSTPNTFVLILTSRMEKLRPQVEAVLEKNNITVDKVDMKRAEGDKGIKVLRYVQQFPNLEEINVYEDRDIDFEAYERMKSKLPEDILFNIYKADQCKLSLLEVENKLLNIINEEIQKLI
jgi:FMN phosphatase YigB (HAD superfamily)